MEIPKDFLVAAQQDAVTIAVAAEKLETAAFFYGGDGLVKRTKDLVQHYEQFMPLLEAIKKVYREMLG